MTSELPADSDGDALRAVAECGSDLSKEMEIDFCVKVPDEATGLEFAIEARKMGFTTNVSCGVESHSWTCYCTKTMIPDYQSIVHVQEVLNMIGRDYRCFSDGWGTFGNLNCPESAPE